MMWYGRRFTAARSRSEIFSLGIVLVPNVSTQTLTGSAIPIA